MKCKTAMVLLLCMMLCSCGNGTQGSSVSIQETYVTTSSMPSTTICEPIVTTASSTLAITFSSGTPITEDAEPEIVVPTEFTEDEEWLHDFFDLNFESAYNFVSLECFSCTQPDVEVCIVENETIGLYGKLDSDGAFANAEKYRESLSDYYSQDAVDIFMDNVTVTKKVDESDELYYDIEGVDKRIYVEIADHQKCDENGEPVMRLTKYIEIDGVMYKGVGILSLGTNGVFEYSKIISMTENEMIFTYPVRQEYTSEFILTGIAEGRLVKENGKWKFGWYLRDDNITDEYNDIWLNRN